MISLFKPFMPELPKLEDIFSSGALAYGQYTKLFEETLKDYFGTPYIIVTSSFSTAISVAATTLGLTFGDEIIASPMACLASTQPYLSSGFKIKWCDVDPLRGTLNPDYLKKIITGNTKAIIHNHYCGYPGYIDEINKIGAEYNIPVIDDGIECFGSEYKNKRIGNCATDVTIFSFGAVRIPNTIDGGAVIFKKKSDYVKSLRIRDLGIDRSEFRDCLGEINSNCDISEIGYSATMSNINGYIGLQQMKEVESLLLKQRNNAELLKKTLLNYEGISSIECELANPNYWILGTLAHNKKDAIQRFRKMGLYASGVHINNNIYSVFGDQSELLGAKDFYNHFVALPTGWWISDYSDVEFKEF